MADVIDTYGRLDALVNNAGAAHINTVELDDLVAIRATFEVNFFGVVAMTHAAMPHLRATGGRLLTISSVGGIVGQPFNEAYCAAKFAVEGFMESLAPVAAAVGVTVSVIEPGAVQSSFVANAGVDREAMVDRSGPYAAALRAYLVRTEAAFANAQSAAEVGDIVVNALNIENPVFRLQTSAGAQAFAGLKLADLDGSVVQGVTASWVVPAS